MCVPRSEIAMVEKDRWIRCVYCGHKLGKALAHNNKGDCLIEIKCHSCKTINVCLVNKYK